MPASKELNYKSIHKWCEHLLSRNCHTIRKITHLGQPVKKDASEMILKYIIDYYNYR